MAKPTPKRNHLKTQKLKDHRAGALAEKAALLYYLLHGYLPARRAPRALAQTDLLLRRGRELVLVEVKYRADKTRQDYALHPSQRHRLSLASRQLVSFYIRSEIRLDLCLVGPFWPFIRVIQNVAEPG